MTQDDLSRNDFKDTITRKGYWFVAVWAAGILFLYFMSGYLGVRTLQSSKAEKEKFRKTWIESTKTDPGAKVPEMRILPGAKPVDVVIGMYINSIGEFSLKEAGWTADFDIWFRWTGESVRPGVKFQVVNGQIDQRERKDVYVRGQDHYERHRVKARLTKFFDPSRFPFSDEGLTIQVEDGTHEAEKLRYVADERGSGINRQGVPERLKITKSVATVKLRSYGSGRGDPRLSAGAEDVHSQFIFAVLVSAPSAGLYIKMFQALFASVAIAFIVFFIKPIFVDPRFGLGIGAVFAAVGNNIFVGTILPPAEGITLTAMVNAIGLATIFLTLVQSAISLYILNTMGKERLRTFFDMVSFSVFLTGYTVVNVMLPLAAKP
jgi:hypothetical protein